jgi:DNA-binding protein YbaB
MASIGAMGNLLKQAQDMQARMAKIQEELANKTVDGSAGGGMVQVAEKDMLEDLVLAAVNDGVRKARDLVSSEMSKITGGLKIPGLMP